MIHEYGREKWELRSLPPIVCTQVTHARSIAVKCKICLSTHKRTSPAIAFGMKEVRIKRYVEPFLHLFPIAMALSFAIPPLIWKMYNASLEDAWCNVQPYPSYCVSWRPVDIECERGKDVNGLSGTMIAMAFGLSVLIVCLMLVVCKVCVAERVEKQRVWHIEHIMSHLSDGTITQSRNWPHHTTVMVLVQAISYVVAFFLSQMFIFLLLIGRPQLVGLDWETAIKLQLFFSADQWFL